MVGEGCKALWLLSTDSHWPSFWNTKYGEVAPIEVSALSFLHEVLR